MGVIVGQYPAPIPHLAAMGVQQSGWLLDKRAEMASWVRDLQPEKPVIRAGLARAESRGEPIMELVRIALCRLCRLSHRAIQGSVVFVATFFDHGEIVSYIPSG